VRLARSLREGFVPAVAPWQRPGARVGLGIGIAHGPATVGQIGFEERLEYAAIGSVANLASRLCAQARDGQILVSEEVRAAAADEADTFALGAIPLKGFAASVNAYEL
jgi:adenylate cyclase